MASRFDELIDRHNTDSIKWDFAAERGKPTDLLPMWVADMDFRAPQAVTDALIEAAQHGVFGYSDTKDDYFNALASWMKRRFDWDIEKKWLIKTPGVVNAFTMAVRAYSKPGDAVLIQPPVYPPMHAAAKQNDRRLIFNELVLRDGRYEIDFEDFERKIATEQVRVFILCNPHNPVGRAWTRDELIRMGDICVKYGVVVVSDEIHQDLVLPGHQHFVFASLKPDFREITVTCTAPSKSFNIAGLHASNIFIEHSAMRGAFTQEMGRAGVGGGNQLGLIACQAAYEHGEAWLDELMQYIQGNVDFAREYLAQHAPMVKLIEPDATYLLWLDFRALGLDDKALNAFITDRAKLWLNDGPTFGPGGSGFQRLNAACPRSVLEQGLSQLAAAISG